MASKKEVAISVKELHKSFKLPHEQHSGIKQAALNIFSKGKKRGYEQQHVLKGLDFQVKKGDFFGIVGRNGSGKSTLLKLLAGIYSPDGGAVEINGSLIPFIELGVGFNPELSGRENVFLNGALLGFSHDEIGAMYDSIVEFAELERFMDQKLKNYSSGMQVRLAFSVAIRAQSDILVLDEVLAVGDANFQKKCNDYFEKQKALGQTIILVTHDMNSVQRFCTKAMLLDGGKILSAGDPEAVALEYERLNKNQTPESIAALEAKVLDGVKMELVHQGKRIRKAIPGDTVNVVVEWEDAGTKNVGIALFKKTGERVFATNTKKEKFEPSNIAVYSIKLDVAPGDYYFRIRLYGETEDDTTALIEVGPELTLLPLEGQVDIDGVVNLDHGWSAKL